MHDGLTAQPTRDLRPAQPATRFLDAKAASIVQTLCAIDHQHQAELAQLAEFPDIAELFGKRLATKYQERRAPYIRALADLHRQRKAVKQGGVTAAVQ